MQSCNFGICAVSSCSQGFANCDGIANNGCEVAIGSDVNNCGACGQRCANVNNGLPACSNGQCVIGQCNQGFGDCDNNPFNGCEVNLSNNASNCGICGKVCPNGQPCTNGACNSPLRPNVMVCGPTGRPVSQFFPQGMNFVSLNGCAPDINTQALFITRSYANGIQGAALQNYLNNGGIVLTEYNISHLVWNAAFGTNAAQGVRLGGCSDELPSVARFNPNDPFWLANQFQVNNNTGCGYAVQGYPGITTLAGWDNVNAAVGYRDLGNGRLWATDFDWQDGQAIGVYTPQLMGYMMTHRR